MHDVSPITWLLEILPVTSFSKPDSFPKNYQLSKLLSKLWDLISFSSCMTEFGCLDLMWFLLWVHDCYSHAILRRHFIALVLMLWLLHSDIPETLVMVELYQYPSCDEHSISYSQHLAQLHFFALIAAHSKKLLWPRFWATHIYGINLIFKRQSVNVIIEQNNNINCYTGVCDLRVIGYWSEIKHQTWHFLPWDRPQLLSEDTCYAITVIPTITPLNTLAWLVSISTCRVQCFVRSLPTFLSQHPALHLPTLWKLADRKKIACQFEIYVSMSSSQIVNCLQIYSFAV